MCRNIRRLHNLEPSASRDEIRDAAVQFVRKISGSTRPSKANEEAFDRAVKEIAAASERLLEELVGGAAPATRDELLERARDRRARRIG